MLFFCLCLNCLVVIIHNRNSNSSGLNNSSKPVCISLRLGLIQRLILCWCCILMMLIYVSHWEHVSVFMCACVWWFLVLLVPSETKWRHWQSIEWSCFSAVVMSHYWTLDCTISKCPFCIITLLQWKLQGRRGEGQLKNTWKRDLEKLMWTAGLR